MMPVEKIKLTAKFKVDLTDADEVPEVRSRRRQRCSGSKEFNKTLLRGVHEQENTKTSFDCRCQIDVGSPRSPRKPPNEKEGGRAKSPERLNDWRKSSMSS